MDERRTAGLIIDPEEQRKQLHGNFSREDRKTQILTFNREGLSKLKGDTTKTSTNAASKDSMIEFKGSYYNKRKIYDAINVLGTKESVNIMRGKPYSPGGEGAVLIISNRKGSILIAPIVSDEYTTAEKAKLPKVKQYAKVVNYDQP